jgi:hypothetical protein
LGRCEDFELDITEELALFTLFGLKWLAAISAAFISLSAFETGLGTLRFSPVASFEAAEVAEIVS